MTPRRAGNFTPRQAAIRVSRIYRFPAEDAVQFVERFGQLEGQMDTQLKALPRDVRQRLNPALGYAIPFDFYLFDGSVGGRRGPFKERCQAAFDMRCRQAGVIFATSSPKIAAQFDGMGGILHGGRVYVFPTVQEALSMFESLPPPEPSQKMAAEEEDEYGEEEEQEWI
jgi:capsular polysaccharide transport system ATP-binding protein